MIGLESSGKTTILYKLHLGEVIATTPTIGFNVETVKFKSLRLDLWDLSGFFRYRPLWTSMYPKCKAFIFVVDSEDRQSISTAKEELDTFLSHPETQKVPLLILANKQDLPNVMPVVEIFDKLELFKVKNRLWFIQGCCALSGEGLMEGMKHLMDMVRKNKKDTIV
jgi:small GTP-binding protein